MFWPYSLNRAGGGFLKGGGVLLNHTHTNLLARVVFGNA
nr:MAG TPA: hypothetical protein [Caudoviricetes sp.]